MLPELSHIQRRVEVIFAEKLNLVVPEVDTDLFATGVLDSLSFVELLMELEREWGTKIGLANLDLMNFVSIARIAVFLRQLLQERDKPVTVICDEEPQSHFA